MSKQGSSLGKLIFVFLAMLAGGYIGFLNRPKFLFKQLPFEKVIFAGTNLKGIDKWLVSTAKTSFNYMLIGGLIGLVCGITIASLIGKSKRR